MDKRTFDDFDEFAENYRDIHTANIKLSGADSYYFAESRVQMLQAYEKNEPSKVLDLGCGDGVSEIFMQQYFSNWKIEGIDVSAKSIEVANEKKLSNSSFAIYDGTNIPFDNGSFDIVFVAGVLHHVEFGLHQAILKEMIRVLKPGGRLLMYEHNPLNPLTKYLVNTCVFDKDARLVRSSYLTRLLVENGFRISEKIFIIFFPRKGILSKLVFLEKYLQWLPLGGKYFIRAVK